MCLEGLGKLVKLFCKEIKWLVSVTAGDTKLLANQLLICEATALIKSFLQRGV
jgi:hypothetical protein